MRYEREEAVFIFIGVGALFILPFLWFLAQRLCYFILGKSDQVQLEKLKKEYKTREEIMGLEAKMEAQESIKGFHREIGKELKNKKNAKDNIKGFYRKW